MALSLMNVLSAQSAPAPAAVADKPEVAANAPAEDRAEGNAFENVMKTSKGSEAEVVERVREAIVKNGDASEVQEVLGDDWQQVIAQVLQGGEAAKAIPAEVVLAVQDVVAQAMAQMPATPQEALQALVDQLPQRELTEDELSDIVAMTGLPAQMVLTVLQDTPAASPKLAETLNIQLQAVPAQAVEAGELTVAPAGAEVKANVAPAEIELTADVAQQEVSPERLQALEKIVDVLQGASSEPESPEEWISRLAAQAEKNASAKIVTDTQAPAPTQTAQVAAATAAQKPQQTQGEKAVEVAPQAVETVEAVEAQSAAQGKVAEVAPPKAEGAAAKAEKPVAEAVAAAPAQKQEKNAALEVVPSKPKETDAPVKATVVQVAPVADEGADAAVPTSQSQALGGGVKADTASATNLSAVPQVGVTTPANTANTSAPVQAQPFSQAAQPEVPVADQISMHVKRAVATGETSIQLHLKPIELGSVDVRIETAGDGQTRIHVTAERRDTLELLQRDARALERALQDIGFKADNSSLSFNLRGGEQQGQQSAAHSDHEQGQGQFSLDGGYAPEAEEQNTTTLPYDVSKAYRLTLDRGVDISV